MFARLARELGAAIGFVAKLGVSMGWAIFWIIVLVIVAAFVVAIVQGTEASNKAKARADVLRDKYAADHLYVSPFGGAFIAISFDKAMVVLGDDAFEKEYLFSEIAEVEVIQNGSSITKTNRGSQLAGAAVGGIALGGVGFLLGGLSGSKRTLEKVHLVALRLTVDDRVRPLHTVKFLEVSPPGVDANLSAVKITFEAAETWNAHIINAMRKAQDERQHGLAAPAPVAAIASQADEIKKLWDLKTMGALTDAEFEARKAALLGG